MVIAVVAALAGACSKKPSPPQNEFEAFERKFAAEAAAVAEGVRARGRDVPAKDVPTTYRAVFIGPSGVFVDRTRVATLAELEPKRAAIVAAIDANLKLLPAIGWTPSMTFDLGAEPASVAISALRLFTGRELTFSVRRDDPEIPQIASDIICSKTTLRDRPGADAELPRLSVLLEAGRIWVGLSKVREFQEIADFQPAEPDFDKLETTLKQHKASAFFADRADLELGASGATSRDVLAAFGIACRAGFVEIAVLPRDQLSAVPAL
jgi:hypothetical protein